MRVPARLCSNSGRSGRRQVQRFAFQRLHAGHLINIVGLDVGGGPLRLQAVSLVAVAVFLFQKCLESMGTGRQI